MLMNRKMNEFELLASSWAAATVHWDLARGEKDYQRGR
jgi:hypothetical protein